MIDHVVDVVSDRTTTNIMDEIKTVLGEDYPDVDWADMQSDLSKSILYCLKAHLMKER